MVCISVIVPVYNCEDYLEESLGSILNQTFNDIEIICIDDGSSDDSLKILNSIASSDSRIQVFVQENQGAGAARNYGYDTMNTEYEGDDVIIVADPFDTTDHNQDGYGVYGAERFIYNFTFYDFFGDATDHLRDKCFVAVTPIEN